MGIEGNCEGNLRTLELRKIFAFDGTKEGQEIDEDEPRALL